MSSTAEESDPATDSALNAAMPREIQTLASAFGIEPGGVKVRADGEAQRQLESRGARGLVDSGVVYLHPTKVDPRTDTGRYVLAHELAHLAQARNAAPVGGAGPRARLAAEAEAAQLGQAHARGAAVSRPLAPLGPGPAADNDAVTGDVEDLLAEPMLTSMKVRIEGLYFTPEPGSRWLAGPNKQLQMTAAALWHLVGKKRYSPRLAVEAYQALRQEGFSVVGMQAETPVAQLAPPFALYKSIPQKLVKWLLARGIELALEEERVAYILAVDDARGAWEKLRYALAFPPWYTESIFLRVILSHRGLLRDFIDARKPGLVNQKRLAGRMSRTQDAIRDTLLLPAYAVDGIRQDPGLVDEPAYRALWRMPPVRPLASGVYEPAPANSVPDEYLAAELLLDIERAPKLAVEALDVDNHEVRKKLLLDFALRMKVRLVDAEGEDHLLDGPVKATMPPLPSSLMSYPALDQQFFDLPEGSDATFFMQLHISSLMESATTFFNYEWQLLEVPENDIKKLAQTALDLEAKGEAPGMGAVLWQRLGRDMDDNAVDIQRALQALIFDIGVPGIGAATLVSLNAILRPIGTFVRAGIQTLAEPSYAHALPFKKSGLYIVRCIASPMAVEGRVIERAPSVAWMPVWVRPSAEMSKLRVDADVRAMFEEEGRFQDLHKELFSNDKSMAPETRMALLSEFEDIRQTLHGDALPVLFRERAMLDRRLTELQSRKTDETSATDSKPDAPAPDSKEIEALTQRIADIDEILMLRQARLLGLESENEGASLEPPVRLTAALVGRNGVTHRLLLEAVERPADGDQLVYAVLDSTTKKSSFAVGAPRENREDAIVDAATKLLESDHGYGRGSCTLYIPPYMAGEFGGAGTTRTIRIEKDLSALTLESIENITLAISVATVAAAPFLAPGVMLSIMIPVGVVGAIPSAYRLADRAALGTLRANDLSMWMDVINVLSAPVGAVRAAASLKLIPVSAGGQLGLMIFGFGLDGLSVAVAGADLYAQIKTISEDELLPDSIRRAQIMELLGSHLLNLGIAAGHHLVMEGKNAKARGGEQAPHVPGRRADPTVHSLLKMATGREIPVYRSESVGPLDAMAVPEFDAYGLIRDIYVVAGVRADTKMIVGHAVAAKMLLRYMGLSGRVRHAINRAGALLSGKPDPKDPGSQPWRSQAFYSAMELAKLAHLIQSYSHEIRGNESTGKKFDAAQEEKHNKLLEDLRAQVREHEEKLTNFEAGPDFVAAKFDGSEIKKTPLTEYTPAPEGHFYTQDPNDKGAYQLYIKPGSTPENPMMVDPSGKRDPTSGKINLVPRETSPTSRRKHFRHWNSDQLNRQAVKDGYPPPLPGEQYVVDTNGQWKLKAPDNVPFLTPDKSPVMGSEANRILATLMPSQWETAYDGFRRQIRARSPLGEKWNAHKNRAVPVLSKGQQIGTATVYTGEAGPALVLYDERIFTGSKLENTDTTVFTGYPGTDPETGMGVRIITSIDYEGLLARNVERPTVHGKTRIK
ncbi:eCIS core domain-containing protein [Polyangium fumosum]|uniref:eCIS core domain-containing protein n=1 Tax=Polyangium fumosum TaxID=889272 RepID=UPI00147885AF|nr:DUF4157 domain-containing protein [Polyangium fumosum]